MGLRAAEEGLRRAVAQHGVEQRVDVALEVRGLEHAEGHQLVGEQGRQALDPGAPQPGGEVRGGEARLDALEVEGVSSPWRPSSRMSAPLYQMATWSKTDR